MIRTGLTEGVWELSIDRPPVNALDDDLLDELAPFRGNVPIDRIGKPEDVAAVIVGLFDHPAAYLTGTTLRVDRGQGAAPDCGKPHPAGMPMEQLPYVEGVIS